VKAANEEEVASAESREGEVARSEDGIGVFCFFFDEEDDVNHRSNFSADLEIS
jgi:hypothetical protein